MGAVLSGMPVPSHLGPLPATHERAQQLAEAIHTTRDPDFGEPDIDNQQYIVLTDTSTLHQHDELFVVKDEDSDNDEATITRDHVKQGMTEQEGWDDDNDDGLELDSDRQGLMGNIHARRSWVDVSDLGENPIQNVRARPRRGSLSAKAGIILVRQPYLLQGPLSHVFLHALGYT